MGEPVGVYWFAVLSVRGLRGMYVFDIDHPCAAVFVRAGSVARRRVVAELLRDNDFVSLDSLKDANHPALWVGAGMLTAYEVCFLETMCGFHERRRSRLTGQSGSRCAGGVRGVCAGPGSEEV